ncbi:hypothetical protein GYA93_10745 [Gordonia desulfuricans]|uniref:Uncharacterized protein n=1 Tax=Gordonia desulfuricans TaxID=89051 RepID=A0A7K3LP77_9ACTN|nr:hypothetical protein [Gordonia desulfuricans]NDK90055.1 hypothetical protein [Gordonia desulfuricans]
MKRTTLAVSLAAAAASVTLATVGVGTAEAAWTVEPGKFTHTQSLVDGTLTLAITNTTTIPSGCAVSVYKASDAAAVAEMATAMNNYYGGTGTTTAITAARAKISQAQFVDLTAEDTTPAGGTETYTWNSKRADSSYTVLQNCAANDQAGTVVWGVSSYVVNGTGVSSGIGTGSLDSLLP